jgi:hypothetical protein
MVSIVNNTFLGIGVEKVVGGWMDLKVIVWITHSQQNL